MLEKLEFVYDGIPSSSMGVINVNANGGLYKEPLFASRNITEDRIQHKTKLYYQGVVKEPLSFPLSFYIDKERLENSPYSDIDIRAIANWLCQDNYKPLYFTDNPDKIYYCMPVQDINYTHAGLTEQGFIELTMRCNDVYVYSPTYLTQVYDYSNNPSGGTIYVFENKGDVSLFPEIEIKKVGNGDITITNQSNGGVIMSFVGLSDGEILYIDCENEDIISDIPGVYRYDNMHGDYLEIIRGVNNLKIEGKCQIQFRYCYKYNY
jgi:phage-related protein